MEKTTWSKLDTSLRAELEALLASPTAAFESDFQDWLAFWLFLLVASVGGIVANVYDLSTSSEPVSLGEMLLGYLTHPMAFLYAPQRLGLFVSLVVLPWTVLTIVRNKGRCGFAALSSALVIVRGNKLKLLRYSDIARTEQRVIRTKKQTFTVLTLHLKDGKKKELNVHGAWASQVESFVTQRA